MPEGNKGWSKATSTGTSVSETITETTEDGKTITTTRTVAHSVSVCEATTKPEEPEQK